MDRALIIRKKWLDMILNGYKSWEMRSTRTKIRGHIGLIEAGSGMIVGEAHLVGCAVIEDLEDVTAYYSHHRVDDLSLLKKWKWAWILDNVIRFDTPKPYNHPKGAVIWVKL